MKKGDNLIEYARSEKGRADFSQRMSARWKDPSFRRKVTRRNSKSTDPSVDPAIAVLINVCEDEGIPYKTACEKAEVPEDFITRLKYPGDRGRGKVASIYKVRALLRAVGRDLAVIEVERTQVRK